MNEINSTQTDEAGNEQGLISFANSDLFDRLYNEAMQMIRESANYLELEGVIERQRAPEKLAPIFACESMRLTTRLLQVTAWLLALRALKGGELTAGEYAARNYRLGSREVCLGGPVRGAGLLPARLIELLAASRQIYERVSRLDELLFNDAGQGANPVNAHLNRIEQAFAS